MPTLPTRTISISIERPIDRVYAFLSKPANFAQWASGLGETFRPITDYEWAIDMPEGPMRLRFTEPNPFGIVDHSVIPETGPAMENPMRVFANGDGSEVVFTLFRRPDMSDADFEHDAEWVAGDFATLKRVLEG